MWTSMKHSSKVMFFLCRLRRMSFVMRKISWSKTKKSWSSRWNYQVYSPASSLMPWLLKDKLLTTNWCLSLVILEFQCGSLCHLLQLIHHRITCFDLRLLKVVSNSIHFFIVQKCYSNINLRHENSAHLSLLMQLIQVVNEVLDLVNRYIRCCNSLTI